METLTAKLTHYYFNCDNFKQKDAAILVHLISNSRLNFEMSWAGYGNISFDEADTAHQYANISFDEENAKVYNRKTANCLVFNLKNSENNPGYYNKLFMYHTMKSNNSAGKWYGYVLYNSITKKTLHQFFIDHEYTDLTKNLNTIFMSMNYNHELMIKLENSKKMKFAS